MPGASGGLHLGSVVNSGYITRLDEFDCAGIWEFREKFHT
ncbi:hypothetical protein HNR49_002235 [Halobacterium salinarum]|uniref:Uncharacterized protein n=1 Tax=Halobacterium salinarum TaxID=2242 RepID=A0A841HEJ0_HALSI|nr:hypothetical protein [Halobacterium salinarum]